ncbi:MAG: aminoglycoside phosphotransferase family protein [Eubacterium sp.]|nr:aminoglycoside phosphotransferase family protein [Eubacterium sp.]
MEPRGTNNVTKEAARKFAVAVLEKKLSCKVSSIKYLGGGAFGFVYLAEIDKQPEKLIMKACRTNGMCGREAQSLTLLGKNSIIKIPKVYFTFLASDDIPIDFICMEFIEGTDCFTNRAFLFKSSRKRKEFADKITSAMRVWHETENDKFGLVGNAIYDSWLDYYKPFSEDILLTARKLHKQGRLKESVMDAMERAWSAFDEIFSEPVEKAGLIHGDLNVMNIMADKNLNPTAIIDPLECCWADTEYDLFSLRNMTGERFGLYETYKSKYHVSEKCDLKTSFYALFFEVYCYILAGVETVTIPPVLVKRMNKELKKLSSKPMNK